MNGRARTLPPIVRMVARLAVSLVLAVIGWALLGYLATLPLGAFYGWSGHPAIPAAPWSVYLALYAVVLPGVCLAGGWYIAGRLLASIWRPAE